MKRAFLACCALTAVGMAALWIAIRPAPDADRLEDMLARRDPQDEAERAVMMAELPHTVARMRRIGDGLDTIGTRLNRRTYAGGL